MKKLKLLTLSVMIITTSSFGQTIIDPVEAPYFVISRESPYVILSKALGGKSVKGFAGMTITLNSSGKLLSTELKKLKLSGNVTLSYQSGQEQKTDIIRKYEAFFKKCVSQIKIVKTDSRKPPKVNNITFIIRF
jgi:hypothetical protein